MQVASMAASMGAFKGEAATGGAGADTSAAASADLATPANLDQFDPKLTPIQSDQVALAESQHNQWLKDNQAAAEFGGKIESGEVVVPDQFTQEAFQPYATQSIGGSAQTKHQMFQDLTGRTGMDHTMTDLQAFEKVTGNPTGAPLEHTGMGGSGKDIQSLEVIPSTKQPIGGKAPALTGDSVSPETGVKPKPTQTTQQPGEPPATKTPNNEPPKPEGGDGKGPGGQKKGFWEGGFNWKNIQEFLASDEGKKWMLSDEGLFGIGQKLTAAAEHGTSTFTTLTLKERKKLLEKLKKARAERKKKEKEKDE